ncbi:hypothetical protein [Alloactinosynnema sp. L-07]|nr:hypothetical protein [Alloactinosynnema sp. L-07]
MILDFVIEPTRTRHVTARHTVTVQTQRAVTSGSAEPGSIGGLLPGRCRSHRHSEFGYLPHRVNPAFTG